MLSSYNLTITINLKIMSKKSIIIILFLIALFVISGYFLFKKDNGQNTIIKQDKSGVREQNTDQPVDKSKQDNENKNEQSADETDQSERALTDCQSACGRKCGADADCLTSCYADCAGPAGL
jgi:hypothetical protein